MQTCEKIKIGWSFLERVYQGSVSMMSTLMRQNKIDEKEMEELKSMLDKM